AEVKALVAGALKEVVTDLVPKFEKSSGNTMIITWTGGWDIRKRNFSGGKNELVVTARDAIDTFIPPSKKLQGSRVDLVKSGIGVAGRAGSVKPDISSGEALKRTLLAARFIGYSTGASGDYLMSLIDHMGISDVVKPKLKQTPSGVRIGTLITSGEVE